MVSLDERLSLCAGTLLLSRSQWFATILGATEIIKIGHNNPFPLQWIVYLQVLCTSLLTFLSCSYHCCSKVII